MGILVDWFIRTNIDIHIPDDISEVILSFYGDYDTTFMSDILTEYIDRFNFMDMICKQLNNNNIQLNRIYSGQINGFYAKEFHKLCDDKGPTITIIQRKNKNKYVFGGYTSISWKSPYKYDKTNVLSDPTAFLFQIIPNIKIFELISKDDSKAVRHNSTYLIGFGCGCDLLIRNNCDKNKNSFATPKSYNMSKTSDLIGEWNGKNWDGSTLKAINVETFQAVNT